MAIWYGDDMAMSRCDVMSVTYHSNKNVPCWRMGEAHPFPSQCIHAS